MILKEVKAYVPVTGVSKLSVIKGIDHVCEVKETTGYLLSREEMENLLYAVHAAGAVYGGEVMGNLPITKTPSQYIQSLLK
jgi:hypothetical protein